MENLFNFDLGAEVCAHSNTKLRPGATVTLVPYGVLVTVQYSKEGRIERVYLGTQDSGVDVTSKYLALFTHDQFVPDTVPLTGGTTWVVGVVTSVYPMIAATGDIPACIQEKLLNSDPSELKFAAAYIVSNALGFSNIKAMQSVLKTYGFHVLPFWTVPFGGLTDDTLIAWMDADTWCYNSRLIMYYIEYINGDRTWWSTGLHQELIQRCDLSINPADGEIRMCIKTQDDSEYHMPLGEAARFQVAPDVMVVEDSLNTVLDADYVGTSYRKPAVSGRYTCPICGKVTSVPAFGSLYCSNLHCGSRLISRIKLMLNTFDLPIGYSDIVWYAKIKDRQITCLTDVFTLPAYTHLDISVPLWKVLRAAVPVALIRSNSVFIEFANKCHNAETTFQYYLANFSRAAFDLGFTHPDASKLEGWLSDPENAADITALLMLPNLHVPELSQSFDGAPIFRNMSICLTGRFSHGDTQSVADFLQSYAASCTTTYTNVTTHVIYGDLQDGINGAAIREAKLRGVPVVSESQWFSHYDLESDWENLQ